MYIIRFVLLMLMLGIMLATFVIDIYDPSINVKGYELDSADMRHILMILQCVLLAAVLATG